LVPARRKVPLVVMISKPRSLNSLIGSMTAVLSLSAHPHLIIPDPNVGVDNGETGTAGVRDTERIKYTEMTPDFCS